MASEDSMMKSLADDPPEKGAIREGSKEPLVKVFPRALSEAEIEMLLAGYVKPLRCRRCDLWFMDRSELMRHIWEVHRKKKGDGRL